MADVHSNALSGDGRAQRAREPDVSFVMAAFNTAPYVRAAVESALRQTDVDVEVILVDDCSSDRTADIVEALAATEPRVTLLRRERREGASVARNAAVDMARGAWIAILDADDLVAPERSRRLLDLATTTSADIIADNFERFIGDDQTPVSTMLDERPGCYSFFVDPAAFFRGNAMFDSTARLGYVKPMFRRAFIESKKIRYADDILIGEDYLICMACLLEGARFVVTSERHYKYRMRPGSLSWRMQLHHVQRLLQAHEALQIEQRFGDDAELKGAARTYADALRRAELALAAVEDAKSGRWRHALLSAAAHPGMWRLLLRVASEAVSKRVGKASTLTSS